MPHLATRWRPLEMRDVLDVELRIGGAEESEVAVVPWHAGHQGSPRLRIARTQDACHPGQPALLILREVRGQ